MSEMVNGKIGIRVLNRTDGTPLLQLRATNAAGRKLMTSLYKDLLDAQLVGITKRKAGTFSPCGSMGINDQKIELDIPLALGGIGLKRNLGLDQVKRKRTKK